MDANTSEYCSVDSSSSRSLKTCSLDNPTRLKKIFHAASVGANTVLTSSGGITKPGSHMPTSGRKGRGRSPRGISGGTMTTSPRKGNCCSLRADLVFVCVVVCVVCVVCVCVCTPSGWAGTRKLSLSGLVRKYASAVIDSSGSDAMTDSIDE